MNRCELYADHRWILTEEGMRCSKCGRAPEQASAFSFTEYVRSVFRRGKVPDEEAPEEQGPAKET